MASFRGLPRNSDLQGEVKDKRDDKQKHLQAKRRVVIVPHGSSHEQKKPDDRHCEQAARGQPEGPGLDRFLSAESARFRKLYRCLQKEYASPAAFLHKTLLAALPHIAAGRSLYDVLSNYFRSEELRLAFTFQSKYLGMSPWDCPSLFAMIPYTEHAHGVYHVMGGLSQIPQALARVAREEGAEVRTSCGVRRVLLGGTRRAGWRWRTERRCDATMS